MKGYQLQEYCLRSTVTLSEAATLVKMEWVCHVLKTHTLCHQVLMCGTYVGCITSTVDSLKFIVIVQKLTITEGPAGQSCLLTLPIGLSLTFGKKYCIMYFFPYDAEAVSEMEVCFSQTSITAREDCHI